MQQNLPSTHRKLGGLRPQLLVCSLRLNIPPLHQLLRHPHAQLQLLHVRGMLRLQQEQRRR